jgi:hypothetical protein
MIYQELVVAVCNVSSEWGSADVARCDHAAVSSAQIGHVCAAASMAYHLPTRSACTTLPWHSLGVAQTGFCPAFKCANEGTLPFRHDERASACMDKVLPLQTAGKEACS